jgi:transposase
MLTIVWNPRGFHLIDVLPKGLKFNVAHYINTILIPLVERRSAHGTANERKLIVHADNARPHTAKVSTQFLAENRMKPAPHPPYSPDLAPCDFYLFGYVKQRLAGFSFDSAEHLLEAVLEVLDGMETVTLEAVFLEWTQRLMNYIASNREYTD